MDLAVIAPFTAVAGAIVGAVTNSVLARKNLDRGQFNDRIFSTYVDAVGYAKACNQHGQSLRDPAQIREQQHEPSLSDRSTIDAKMEIVANNEVIERWRRFVKADDGFRWVVGQMPSEMLYNHGIRSGDRNVDELSAATESLLDALLRHARPAPKRRWRGGRGSA